MSKKIILIILGISLATPFLYTLYFLKINEFQVDILVDLGSLFLLTIMLILYLILENDKKRRFLTVTITVGLIMYFIGTYKFQLKAANYIFFKFRENEMYELVNEIKEYGKIYTMTNMMEYNNQINDTEVEANDEKGEIKIRKSGALDLKQYLTDFNIEPGRFETIRKDLVKLRIRRFKKVDDNIFFSIRAYPYSNGYVYSENGFEPAQGEKRKIFKYQRVADKWFYFYID